MNLIFLRIHGDKNYFKIVIFKKKDRVDFSLHLFSQEDIELQCGLA